MTDKQWLLLALGFNGFGQLDSPEALPGGDEDTCSKKHKQATVQPQQHQEDELVGATATGGVQQQHEMVMMVDTPIELMCFSSRPSLTVSVSWDAVHIHAKVDVTKQESSIAHTITTGRWRKAMDKCKKHLKLNGPARRVTETNDHLIFQTEQQTFVLSQQQHEQVSQSDLRPLCFVALSDSKTYALLDNGDFHEVSFKEKENSKETKCVCLLTLSAQVQTGIPIRQVACGANHILLLAHTGVLFSFGLNDRGQLGHGNIRARANPTVVEALEGIAMIDIACGHWHCIALSEYGDVYSWGWNEHNQLGHSVDTSTVAIPTLIEGDEDINFVSVSCGTRHSAALSETHVLYVWGWNGYGQLGRSSSTVVHVPTQLNGLSDGMLVESVYCGHWCTFILASKVMNNE